ncbi:hypothetical protein [Alcanivorax sediminis]|uniref:Uncharacterized protein n=1 Tax=Alcanivorax sediminis TaxID=2663008 RepID=A0A6N7LPD2_9GAMM|nr:hypothetical protein [Alcanivorax sediminis]MQX52029.1 hypothetical protein [Alcanivorax sediminis]
MEKVNCRIHGSSGYALVCQHLANQCSSDAPMTYYLAADDDSPDRSQVENAWCDECDKVLLREGDWNDTSEAFASVKVICAQCFNDMKMKNRCGNP